ncbi:MAG: PIN domain-containing protein [Planctomycetaceae bacterium]
MAFLIDSSVLGRLANAGDARHALAVAAVLELHRQGETIHLTSQVLIEFRNFATRPVIVNGLGASAGEAEAHSRAFEARFPLLDETSAIYPAWKSLVEGLGVIGKQVHDARLVAVCHVHSVTHLLTFNTAHFNRLAAFAPGVAVVDPASV